MISPRIQTWGYWGVPTIPAFAINLNAGGYEAASKIAGGLLNVRRYRSGNDSGATQAAIGLDFKNVYSDTDNTESVWTPSDATYFEEIPNAFNDNKKALLYSNGAADTVASFVSTFTVAENRAFSFRIFLFEPHEDQHRQVVALMWERWRFEIVDGSASIYRTSTAWTTAKQTQLDELLNTDEQLSEADQTTADTLRLEIYEEGYTSGVSVESHKTDAGEWFEVTFLPEPRGILNILSGRDETAVERTDIIDTRTVGTIWPASAFTLTTTGGAMFWQIGFPQFAVTGRIRTPNVKWWYQSPLTGMTFRGQLDESSPNTDIALDLYDVPDSIEYYAQADFSSDGNYSPFLYAVEGFVEAGERTGDTLESWNSDNAVDFDDNGTPIMEFSPSYESEMRRKNATMVLRFRPGTLNLPGESQQMLHDRMCSVTLNDTAFITRGVIRSAQLGDARMAFSESYETDTLNQWSTLTLEIADQWAVLDCDVMQDNPKGDGRRLGAYIRTVLAGAGVKDSEMTGVSATAGRILPSAAPGEDFLIQPGGEVSRGDYLRSLVLDWGMGLQLYISNAGIWTLALPSATPVAAFSSSATSGYRILEPLDVIRDYGDAYNWFCVEGAEINGRRLRQTWTVHQSLNVPDWVGYVGRWRRFPTIRNDGLRTQDEVQWVLRSRVRNHAKPGRFFSFLTNFHQSLDIGQRVTVDGVLCEIVRIDGGSIQYNNDRMTLVVQEVIGVGA